MSAERFQQQLTGNTLWVDKINGLTNGGARGRGWDRSFPTIQKAIDAAVAGDGIYILPGTFTENITLKNDVDIRGFSRRRVLISGTVSASGVTCEISDLRISGTTTLASASSLVARNVQLVGTLTCGASSSVELYWCDGAAAQLSGISRIRNTRLTGAVSLLNATSVPTWSHSIFEGAVSADSATSVPANFCTFSDTLSGLTNINLTGSLNILPDGIQMHVAPRLPTYTFADNDIPSAGGDGGLIIIEDETNGRQVCYNDGLVWRRISDGGEAEP